jgi:Fur family ferric uptake transcriptional regulator
MTDLAQVMQQVRDEARKRGVRWTNQRQIIVETFIATDDHVTAEELHQRVRRLDASVSAATVYRTINLLVEIGVAHKRHFSGGSASFESALTKTHHDHLVCMSCGQITEFVHEPLEVLQDQIAAHHGFRLLHHRMELYGVCRQCSARGAEVSASAWHDLADR